MNRKIQIIIPILLIAIYANGQKVIDKNISSRYFYSKNNTEILYDNSGIIVRIFKHSYVGVPADVSTFEPIAENLAKDNKHVFHKNEILTELDAATCSYDKEHKILRDKNRVFLFETKRGILLYEILGADPETYGYVTENFPANWWRDKNHYFYRHNKLEVDRITFRWDSINDVYKDNKNVFLSQIGWKDSLTMIEGADPESYTKLHFDSGGCTGWSRDKGAYYYNQKKISADPHSLKFDICSMPYDKDSIYIPMPKNKMRSIPYKGKIHILGSNVMADDSNVYLEWGCSDVEIKSYKDLNKIKIVANDKFRKIFLIDDYLYIRPDGESETNRQISGVDFDTYHLCLPDSLQINYGADKSRVYYGTELIFNADPETFEVMKDLYSKDKNNVYYLSRAMKEADPETFEVIGNLYAKDKNAVYYRNEILEKADPSTFVIFDNDYGKDKKYVYEKDRLLEGYKPEKFVMKKGRYPHQKSSGSSSSRDYRQKGVKWYRKLPGPPR